MKRASPVDLRKAKYLVEEFVRAGIDFVPIPVVDQDHKPENRNKPGGKAY